MIKCLSVTNERVSANQINCPQYEVLEVDFSSESKLAHQRYQSSIWLEVKPLRDLHTISLATKKIGYYSL